MGAYQSAKLELSPGTRKVLRYIVHRTESDEYMLIAFDYSIFAETTHPLGWSEAATLH